MKRYNTDRRLDLRRYEIRLQVERVQSAADDLLDLAAMQVDARAEYGH